MRTRVCTASGGATVRNILEFPERFPGCEIVKLTRNYRSHEKIVAAYDTWMASADWSNPGNPERPFRYEKAIEADRGGANGKANGRANGEAGEQQHPDYPAVFSIWGQNAADEAARFADFVAYLKEQGVISDYNQVALLLHSVRSDHSGPYIEALSKKGIRAFCPRARSYFDNEEIRLMVGCFAVLFSGVFPVPQSRVLVRQTCPQILAAVAQPERGFGRLKRRRMPHSKLAASLQALNLRSVNVKPLRLLREDEGCIRFAKQEQGPAHAHQGLEFGQFWRSGAAVRRGLRLTPGVESLLVPSVPEIHLAEVRPGEVSVLLDLYGFCGRIFQPPRSLPP